MSTPEARMIAKGYTTIETVKEPPPATMGWFSRAVVDGDTVYASGHTSGSIQGKVPSEMSEADAKKGAEAACANLIHSVRDAIGSLDRVRRVVKVTGFVNADTDYHNVSAVVNGASELLHDVFGDAGIHSRSALGMAQLPGNASVEIEVIFKLKTT